MHDELSSPNSWFSAKASRRGAIAKELAKELGAPWAAEGETLKWREVTFLVVPGGRFERGRTAASDAALKAILARAERYWQVWNEANEKGEDPEAAIEAEGLHEGTMVDSDMFASYLRDKRSHPATEVEVAPYLLSRHPLTRAQVAALEVKPTDFAPNAPVAYLSEKALASVLETTGARLPSEVEWEWAARGGTSTLWWGGDEPPTGKEMTDPGTHPWGFELIGHWSERCADGWHSTLKGAPSTSEPWSGKGYAVRGGSAEVWPWQGCNEWIGLLACTRGKGSDWPKSQGHAVRLARSLP